MMSLRGRIDADELHFWGKISGIANDYYVAVAVTYAGQYEFPCKNFYWALSTNFNFRELPTLSEQHDGIVDLDEMPFEGNPDKVLDAAVKENEEGEAEPEAAEAGEEDEEKQQDSDATEEEEIAVPKRDLKEIDRLTFVVFAIENDCQICPVGSFKMTSEHQVTRNESFNGLKKQDAHVLDNYMHFRNVQTEDKKNALDDPAASFNTRFLESAACDQPKGTWTLQKRTDFVHIRSLKWPGYQFYHKQSSNKFGGMYIGDGLKNLELHFIV